MSKDVETKVVEMQFDNKKFHKGIQQTIEDLRKLEKNMEFKGSGEDLEKIAKNLEEIDKESGSLNDNLEKGKNSIQKIAIGVKDIIKIRVVEKVVDNIANRLTGMVKSLTGMNNIMAGWEKYETQITNIGGILNNVGKDFENEEAALEAISGTMARLQQYTDETSFSFSTLSTGIRQFTTAGIALAEAEKAALGVTTLAGASKVFEPYKVQSAMDAVSKAMQTGYMDVQKWTSLTNTAGIVSEEFSQILLDTAVAEGKLAKSQAGQYKTKSGGKLVTTQNIRNTLSDKWLTSDVLTKALSTYTEAWDAYQQLKNEAEASGGSLLLGDLLDPDSESYRKLQEMANATSIKALASSVEATSLSQAIQATKDASATAWQTIFQSVFGGYKEATKFWTNISGDLYEMFVDPLYSVVEATEKWHDQEEGGYMDFAQSVRNLMEFVKSINGSIGEVFSEVFDVDGAEILTNITKKLLNWTEGLKDNERPLKVVSALFKTFFTVIKANGKVLNAAWKVFVALFKVLEPLIDIAADLIVEAADGVVWLIETVDQMGILDDISEGLATTLRWLAEQVRKIVNKFRDWAEENQVLQKSMDWMKDLFDKIGKFFSDISAKSEDFFANNKYWQELVKNFSDMGEIFNQGSFLDSIEFLFEKLKTGFSIIGDGLKSTEELKPVVEFFETVLNTITPLISAIGDLFKNSAEKFKTGLEDGSITWVTILDYIRKIVEFFMVYKAVRLVSSLVNIIKEFEWILDETRKNLMASRWKIYAGIILDVAISLGILALAIGHLSKIDAKKAWSAVGMMSVVLAEFIGIWLLISKVPIGFVKGTQITKMIGAVLALSLFVSIVTRMTKKLKDVDWTTLGKTTAFVGAITLIFTGFFALSKNTIKAPSLWSLIKIAAIVLLFVKNIDPIVEAINQLNKWNFLAISGIAIGAFALIQVITIGINALIAKARITHRGLSGTGFKYLLSVSAFMLAIIGVMKVMSTMSESDIQKTYARVTGLLSIIMAFTLLTNLLSRVITTGGIRGLFRGGATKMSNSPIGSMLLAMTASIGLLIVFIKLLADMSDAEIDRGMNIIARLSAFVIAFGVLELLASRKATRASSSSLNGLNKSLRAIVLMVGLIFGIVIAMKIVKDSDIDRAMSLLRKIALFISTLLVVLAITTGSGKFGDSIGIGLGSSSDKMLGVLITITALIGILAGIVIALTLIDADDYGRAIGVIAAIIGLVAGLTLIIGAAGLLLKRSKGDANVSKTFITITACLTGLMLVASGLVMLASNTSWEDLGKAGAIVGAMALILLEIAGLAKLLSGGMSSDGVGTSQSVKMMRTMKTFSKMMASLAVLLIVVSAMVYGAKYVTDDEIKKVSFVLAAIAGLFAALAILVKISENVNGGKIAAIIAMIDSVIVVFGAFFFFMSVIKMDEIVAPIIALVGIVLAFTLLTTAILIMGKTDTKQIGKALLVALIVTAVLAAMTAVVLTLSTVAKMGGGDMNKIVLPVLELAIAFVSMASAIALMGQIANEGSILKAIVVAVIVAGTLEIMTDAAKKLQGYDWKELATNLGIILGAVLTMGLIMAALGALGEFSLIGAAVVAAIVVEFVMMAAAAELISRVLNDSVEPIKLLGTLLSGLALGLVEVSGAISVLSGAIAMMSAIVPSIVVLTAVLPLFFTLLKKSTGDVNISGLAALSSVIVQIANAFRSLSNSASFDNLKRFSEAIDGLKSVCKAAEDISLDKIKTLSKATADIFSDEDGIVKIINELAKFSGTFSMSYLDTVSDFMNGLGTMLKKSKIPKEKQISNLKASTAQIVEVMGDLVKTYDKMKEMVVSGETETDISPMLESVYKVIDVVERMGDVRIKPWYALTLRDAIESIYNPSSGKSSLIQVVGEAIKIVNATMLDSKGESVQEFDENRVKPLINTMGSMIDLVAGLSDINWKKIKKFDPEDLKGVDENITSLGSFVEVVFVSLEEPIKNLIRMISASGIVRDENVNMDVLGSIVDLVGSVLGTFDAVAQLFSGSDSGQDKTFWDGLVHVLSMGMDEIPKAVVESNRMKYFVNAISAMGEVIIGISKLITTVSGMDFDADIAPKKMKAVEEIITAFGDALNKTSGAKIDTVAVSSIAYAMSSIGTAVADDKVQKGIAFLAASDYTFIKHNIWAFKDAINGMGGWNSFKVPSETKLNNFTSAIGKIFESLFSALQTIRTFGYKAVDGKIYEYAIDGFGLIDKLGAIDADGFRNAFTAITDVMNSVAKAKYVSTKDIDNVKDFLGSIVQFFASKDSDQDPTTILEDLVNIVNVVNSLGDAFERIKDFTFRPSIDLASFNNDAHGFLDMLSAYQNVGRIQAEFDVGNLNLDRLWNMSGPEFIEQMSNKMLEKLGYNNVAVYVDGEPAPDGSYTLSDRIENLVGRFFK